MKRTLVYLVMLIAGLHCSVHMQQKRTLLTAPGAGQDFPIFQLKQAGQSVVNSRQLFTKQDYTIVVFWTSWCTYCSGELKYLDNFKSENKPAPIAVNIGDSEAAVLEYKQTYGLKLPVLLDSPPDEESSGSLADTLSITSFPTIFLLYRGKIIFKQRGWQGETKSLAITAWQEHSALAGRNE